MTWQEMNGRKCGCGRVHSTRLQVISGKNALLSLGQTAAAYGQKAFVLADANTQKAAGERVCRLLKEAGLGVVSHVEGAPMPDERTAGSVLMHYDPACDLIVAVGSGVINDLGKLLAAVTGKPYIIVATAPSMDGYASATSSMERGGLKVSLPTRAPDVIVGDEEILAAAPKKLMAAGLGDMLAKYISICEWRIAHLLWGEPYCEEIAGLVRSALQKCVKNAPGLLRRDPEAVMAVFDGLVIGGVAMNYAGLSRPASGCEHYISHVLDMRGVSLGTPTQLHGLQCAVGTYICAGLYEKLLTLTPDARKAELAVAAFDRQRWNATLRDLLGASAESMIALEEKEGKYDKKTHPARLQAILSHWPEILEIIRQEVPPAQRIYELLKALDAPTTLEALGTDEKLLPLIFGATRDIRDKYVLSRLCWDLGVTEEII